MSFIKYIYKKKSSELLELTEEEYYDTLVNICPAKAERAFEKAWATRNFEIEMYWKRATYFWAFIASIFVGYFALVSSENYVKYDRFNHVEVYFLICIGFILSVAWHLTNMGSKSWQRHWEVHVDLLEDAFTGPLYKTVHPQMTYSVSKINEIVSFVFVFIWPLLGIKYLFDQNLIRSLEETKSLNWFVLISTLMSFLVVFSMIFGYGRGRFGTRSIKMYRRSVSYENKGKSM
ncbi:hypothetical protein J8995_02000 [Klebsiella quasipneumoniae subsp. quasipneumoniae]|jgi:hypothetical protein|uniref:Uncharacterized protein n=1 Tax=Klebsiella pneumoniae TaxID=573 RepID=A0A486QFR3_KLEPN|nr:hypothetical protein [Klebsiella quasipneumoniae]VGL88310.1 Uncharacterised protein [Klebsiella pneumoniae]MBR7466290.1 hypothetical protein [Klebsiella quasipneumoniae]MBV0688759.1 hypothetical protein [Klebsiella quasipneumoniae]MCJ4908939.1 hypothetical protein [Klebsiella quasipneumoniae]MDZ0895068.1 hypothetical protein [Klebsiella quasipneumoniae]